MHVDPHQPADEREVRYGKQEDLPRVAVHRAEQRAVVRTVVRGEDKTVNQASQNLRYEEGGHGRKH